MSPGRGNEEGRRRLSLALAIIGAVIALIGGVLLYARENVFDADALSDRAEEALTDERLRLALAQPISEAIIDSGPTPLVNARPLIESVVTGALGTPPVRAVFGEAVRSVNAKLFEREPDTLLLNLATVAELASTTIEAVSPKVAASIPPKLRNIRIELTDSAGPISLLELAEEVRLGGLLLPPIALLLLVGSVLVVPDRRGGLVRAGLAVGGAAVVGVIGLAVGRAIVISQFGDPLIRDAAAASWDAVLGDLRGAFLIVGVLAIVLAAAARFTGAEEFDPLAPFVRAGKMLRGRPDRPVWGVLRGIAFVGIGVALVFNPEVSIEAVAVIAGAWVLYVGVGELLAILAPPVATPAAGPTGRRRLDLRRAIVLGGAVAIAVAIVVVVSGGEVSRARPLGPPAACNGYQELCAKRLDEITFPSTHNSNAAAEESFFFPNQRYGIIRQLDDGIRGLLIDTHYGIRRGGGRGFAEVITDLEKEGKTRQEVVGELGEEAVQKAENLVNTLAFNGAPGDPKPYFCHVLCELGAIDVDKELGKINEWMQRHPDEFLVLFIEDVVSPEETARAFEDSGLLRFAYVPGRNAPSPPLGELIENDRRLLVLAENDSGGGRYPWYLQGFDYIQETPYTFRTVDEIKSPQSCQPSRGSASNPFFQINSWIEKIPRDPNLAAKIDSEEILLERVERCERIRGLRPNLIAVDYYEEGDVFAVANVLNGIPADAEPQVRTLR